MIIIKKPLHYHTLNRIIDELDFKTAFSRGTIILHTFKIEAHIN